LFDEALNEADNGNYNQAIVKFKEALIAEPQNPDIHRELGIAYYKSKDFSTAISYLNKALQLNNIDGTAIFYLGLSYESIPNYDKALEYYKSYINSGYSSGNTVEIIEGRIQWIANKKIEADVKKALLVENEIKADTIQTNSLAVLYFQNIGNNKALDPLQKGLTEMLITDLSKVKNLRVIERVKLQKLLDEIGLGQSGFVAENTAPRVGKIFGVNKLVKGTFLDIDSTNFRMGVGVIGTKSGDYQDLSNVSGSLEDLFRLEKELTFSVVDEMGIKLTDEERESIRVIPTESYLVSILKTRAGIMRLQSNTGKLFQSIRSLMLPNKNTSRWK
jgi:tetratricopeptide (TPR) repeat protein